MKIKNLFLMIIVTCFVLSMNLEAGKKESKANSINIVNKPNKTDAFQLHLQFDLPVVPKGAHIDQVFLILDQKFEAPVIADTSRRNSARDTMDVPRGLVNKHNQTILLSVFGFSEGQLPTSDWVDGNAFRNAVIGSGSLLPRYVIQHERKGGRWKDEAVKLSVTQFIREAIKKGSQIADFVVSGSGENSEDLNASNVEIQKDLLKGRLEVYFTEPTVLPHPMGKQ